MQERIQKIISAAGITSRRAAEQLILDGRVRVNGQVVTELGTKADAAKDHIKVDGKLINPRQPLSYIMLNKPAGYVTTMSDPEGRPTVQHLLKGVKVRVYPVGRLDYNTEGLLLLTNDGDFAHLITHPSHEFPKTYRAKVKGALEDHQIEQLEKGIYLDDGRTAPAKLKKISKEEANSWLEITIHEGRKRQVRRMFDRVGHSVIKLKRVRTGNLHLGDLPEGSFRYLTPDEVSALKELALAGTKTEMPAAKPVERRPGAGERTGKPEHRAVGGLAPRSGSVRRGGAERRRPDEKRASGPRPPKRDEAQSKRTREQRVPGRGASGRGPRRSTGEAGSQSFGGISKRSEFLSKDRPRSRTGGPGQEAGRTDRTVTGRPYRRSPVEGGRQSFGGTGKRSEFPSKDKTRSRQGGSGHGAVRTGRPAARRPYRLRK
jgi:23S rRNA pseudouridine2605 synthase